MVGMSRISFFENLRRKTTAKAKGNFNVAWQWPKLTLDQINQHVDFECPPQNFEFSFSSKSYIFKSYFIGKFNDVTIYL